jgi:hypothetical protein
MAEPDKRPVTLEELLVSSLAQTDALAKLLIEKGLITREEFMQKIFGERASIRNFSIPPGNSDLRNFNPGRQRTILSITNLFSPLIYLG